jgi:hypothetical protein
LRKRPWAVRKPKYWRIEHPGDLVEIDTKEIRMPRGVILKHFSARDVISRWDVVEVHRRATSLAAARFLDALLDRLPFPVKALQVDGGSEFAAEFEQACQQKQLPLCSASSVLGLPHSTGICKVSLIYWTSWTSTETCIRCGASLKSPTLSA